MSNLFARHGRSRDLDVGHTASTSTIIHPFHNVQFIANGVVGLTFSQSGDACTYSYDGTGSAAYHANGIWMKLCNALDESIT